MFYHEIIIIVITNADVMRVVLATRHGGIIRGYIPACTYGALWL